MSISTEDFLKNIYLLKFDQHQKASSSNIARRLGISNAAVTDMAKKLSARGMINYRKYKEITLTTRGEKEALKIIRRHRLWELFLAKVLQIPVTSIHREAELLEHHTSEFLTEKMDEFLGHPDFDPHGDPIPDETGQMPPSSNVTLNHACIGKKYVIDRILCNTEDLGQYFFENKLLKGQSVIIDKKTGEEGALIVTADDKSIEIDPLISNNIYVKEKAN